MFIKADGREINNIDLIQPKNQMLLPFLIFMMLRTKIVYEFFWVDFSYFFY